MINIHTSVAASNEQSVLYSMYIVSYIQLPEMCDD